MPDTQPSPVLPLFPLPMIVLPGETIGLHIFEPRYQDLLADIRRTPNPAGDFVIPYETEGDRSTLGTAVRLRRVLREEDDGRADILVEGCRRVLVGERFELHRYESGRVIDFADLSSDWDEALANRVYSLHRQLLVTVTGDEPPDALYHQREALSWVVAACCGLDASDKIDLLLLRDENERLRRVLAALERLHPQLAAAMPKIHGILASYAMTRLAGEAG
jgi:Lon protease-like protein